MNALNEHPGTQVPFEPMPLHALGEMTLDELLDEFDYSSNVAVLEFDVRRRYTNLVAAIAEFRFPDDHWPIRVLHRMTASFLR